jgi:hypothetical protein
MIKMQRVRLAGLPGFSNHDQDGLEQLFYGSDTAQEFYTKFRGKIFNAFKNRSYLPVMRMCDGEYTFCVG